MKREQFDIGDLVFAAEDIINDGGMPGCEESGLIAPAGTRGVVVHYGHAELDPSKEIYLVRFESGAKGELGNPVCCLPEELSQPEAA